MTYKTTRWIAPVFVTAILVLSGCSHNEPLGESVTNLRTLQTYNPSATQENMGLVPEGVGEKMQQSYDQYVGKDTDDLSTRSSKVLEEFN
ncbi:MULTISPECIES: hypothetical protein [Vibrio]|jgi:hypothetical protein|uniref:hypothetical protein n=1 Tax=Vibrio TaxID=662 RepID=UPI0004A2CC49|nr:MULTISPECIES: hypothetical protein [Vibrio]AIV06543.1 hypothetical protein LA59_14120 [Vibrio harveyi]AWA99575.1 hypothetical protein CU052_09770 [Vibrio harveyi]EKO3798211.1 hypothetical protein [Vibrio harveyi]EKO3805195.1 hypothetical protein [Vibrio harveyi]EKO3847806.1 hypothetical protein [Vibrio harveyi]